MLAIRPPAWGPTMPRDDTVLPEVPLPGGRVGRLVPASDAGQFAIVTAASWIDRLHRGGVLGRDEYDVATLLQDLFERSGVRPRLVGGTYDGAASVDGGGGSDGRLLESLSPGEMAKWRRLGKLLALVPKQYRTCVSLTSCWDLPPLNIRALQRGLTILARRALRRPEPS
jgi:hypothetical protein